MKYLFSIIIPVFNAEDFLMQCINSILNQKHDNIEIILVDDCSNDRTASICLALENKHSFIRRFTNDKNFGVGVSRNRGNKLAVGKYLIFVDSDDELFPNALQRLENHIVNNKDPDVIVVNYKKNTFPKSSYQLITEIENFDGNKEKFIKHVSKKQFPLSDQWAFVVRRNFVLKNGVVFSDVRIGEGELFVSSLICRMQTYSGMRNQFYKKKDRDGSLNHTSGYEAAKSALGVLIDLFTNNKQRYFSSIEQQFYKSYINSTFGIFSALLVLLKNNEIQELSSILDKKKDELGNLKKEPEMIDLYPRSAKYDSYDTLINFRNKIMETKSELIRKNSKNYKYAYLYCRSKYTAATIKCLSSSHLQIQAIIDDSENYCGTVLMGYPTIDSKTLLENVSNNISKSLIIVTHQRAKVLKKIASSLLKKGLRRSQIITLCY